MERINKFWQSITLTHHLKGPVTVLGVHVSWRLHISAFDENYLVEWYSILDLLLLHGIMSLKVNSKKWENKLRIQGLISSSFSIEINLAGLSVHPNLNHLGFLRVFSCLLCTNLNFKIMFFAEGGFLLFFDSHLLWLQLWLELGWVMSLETSFFKNHFLSQPLSAWRNIPVCKWLITPVCKSA